MEKIKKTIEFLASKINGTIPADDALKFSQAALNLANCEDVQSNTDNRDK